MSDRRKDPGMDDMFHYFIKEMVKKGMEGFPPGAADKEQKKEGNRPVEDIFDFMREAREKFREARSSIRSTFDTEAEVVEEEDIKSATKEKELLEKEIELLKEQIDFLKEQLHDKEEIIDLLKEKSAKPKTARSSSAIKPTRKKTTK